MKNFTLIALLSLFSWQVNAQITTYPYVEDFESGAGGWTAPGTVWELGTPAATVINSAASGVNSWATQLAGTYPTNSDEAVVSPVFDFSGVINPAISFSAWWDSENNWDGTVLQSSIDGGVTWQNVGNVGDPNNWHNNAGINSNPGGQSEGWSASPGSGGWVTASNNLTGLAGQSNVLLRFAFGSDGSVVDDGFAFDDVTVFDAPISSFPYTQDFEAGAGGWTTPGAVWQLGTPSAPTINSAASGTNSWATVLAGQYPVNADESVVSPAFDFSGILNPAISFSAWWNSEFSWDGTVLQSSIDGGTTWQNVGNLGDPNNWFNDGTINGAPGGQQQGWTGRDASGNGSGGWVTASNDLTGLAGQSNVLLRFAFGSDGSVTDDGFAFDDITVFNVSCAQPTAINATNFTGTTLDLGWTDNAGAGTWNIEFGPAGFAPTGTPTISGTTNNPTTVPGVTFSTTYDFYVQADCGGSVSVWSGPFTYTTACATFPAPFIESFENTVLPICWTQGGPTAWEFGSTATGGFAQYGLAGALDYSASGTGSFIGIDGSDNTTGEVSTLTSPFIDASTLAVPMMSYAVFYNNIDDGTLNELLVEFWDGAAWNTVATINQNQGPDWVEFTHILAGFTITGDVQMRFTVTGGTGTTFYNDIVIDDVELKEAPPCPNPSSLTFVGGDDSSAELAWTNGYLESEWTLEYGPIGFVPGTGNTIVAPTNPDTITGLAPNTFYDVYVYANCSVTDTSDAVGPVTVNTYNQGIYMEADTDCPTAGFVDISTTGVNLNMVYNGEVPVDPIPFAFVFQGQPITNMLVGNNGGLQLGTNAGNILAGGNFNTLPDGTLFAWGDLLDDETGDVFWQQVGTSPNSTLIVQWNNINNAFGNATSPTVTFQIQIDEATGEIFYVYDDVEFGAPNLADDFGGNADIGVAGPNQDIATSVNSQTYLQENSCVHYYYTDCPKPINYNLSYTTANEAAFTWNAGLSNETEWQVIYGVEGFDPLTGGTSVTVNTGSALIIPGLDDVTVYDVYILSLCANGDTSLALTGQFETLPNCADITGLAGATAIDSIFTQWNFTANTGFPIAEFAMEYGPTGFNNGNGTFVFGIDTINTTDTLFDATLMSGGLYDVYIQSICLTGDSSNFVGPITVTMPLTNDSTCLAQALPVDNNSYTFNGAGAGVSPGEINIAPPAGPCNGNLTWCNSTMSATTWYTFVAPASGNVRIDGETANFDGQIAVYETADCADFNQYNLIGANDDFNLTGDDYPYLNLCGLTPGDTYYMVHDPNAATGIYSIRIQEIVVEAGSDNGLLNVCLGDTVDLNTQVSGADAGGTWTEDILTAGFNDPIWASTGLASQVYTFEYTVVDGCATDSVATSVEVYAPSFAGNDGTLSACQNEPINLLQGLVGSTGVDITGTWYDPANNALPNGEITVGTIPGQFNYDYIAGNGVCPDDTANVIVTVLTCDYLDLQEVAFEGMDLYPNPTANVFYISNAGSSEVFNYELTDLNGKVIAEKEAAINGVETTEVNVEKLETGVYLIRIFNENAEKTFRVVKH